MREGGKKLRRLGLAAVFVLAASAAAAQTQEFSTGQRNLACGSPASLGDGWPTATPESVGLDGARLCGIAARLAATNANVHAVVIVAPWQSWCSSNISLAMTSPGEWAKGGTSSTRRPSTTCGRFRKA